MVIQHNNYEQYITDYLDGNLSNKLTKEMDDFFNQHPDLLDEAIAIQEYKIPKTTFLLNDSVKESLFKKESHMFSLPPVWKMGIAASLLCVLVFTSGFLLNQARQNTTAQLKEKTRLENQQKKPLVKVTPIEQTIKVAEKKQPLKIKPIDISQERNMQKKQVKPQQPKKQKTVTITKKTTKQIPVKPVIFSESKKNSQINYKPNNTNKISKKVSIESTSNKPEMQIKQTQKESEHLTQKPILIAKIQEKEPKAPTSFKENTNQTGKLLKAETYTEKRILAKNDSLKTIHKTSLHELFTENKTESEKKIKNRRFVRKTGKFLKSVLNIEEVSKREVKQAFIPKSIKIKKEK